jgi:tRNA G18 (ribose-2'-O)-methylase SpoU
MSDIRRIESFASPQLAPYRTLRYQAEHRRSGIFVAEGEKTVRRLIASSLAVVSVVVPEHLLDTFEPLVTARGEEIPVFVAPKKLLESLTGFPMYQGVMAVGKVPAPVTLETLLARAAQPRMLAAADGISNAQNMGSLVRNCAAFGVGGLLVGQTSCSPFLRRAVASSAGTIFVVPILELDDLAGALKQLRAQGVRCVGAHPSALDPPIAGVDLAGDSCVVLGSEGHGISPGVLDQCDETAAIPMPPQVDSLNVASASAVFLYEAMRQRAFRGSPRISRNRQREPR